MKNEHRERVKMVEKESENITASFFDFECISFPTCCFRTNWKIQFKSFFTDIELKYPQWVAPFYSLLYLILKLKTRT